MRAPRLRFLFPHPTLLSAPYFVGGIKAFRAMVARIRSDGHECEVVTVPTTGDPLEVEWDRLGWDALFTGPRLSSLGDVTFALTRVLPLVHRQGSERSLIQRAQDYVELRSEFGRLFRTRVQEGNHDWIVWETSFGSFDLPIVAARRKLVLFVQATLHLPFGPLRSSRLWEIRPKPAYRLARKIIVPSRYLQTYLRRYANVASHVVPCVAYGRGPWPNLATGDGVVTMVNPTPPKGVSLFIELAKSFPEQKFRAIAGWGQAPAELSSMPNVEMVSPSANVDVALAGTKILLMPSMWGEAWGLIAMDAMLRGIPVLASTDGGLPEATLGIGRALPVRPMERRWTRKGRTWLVPAQDAGPWREALGELLRNPDAYARRSTESRDGALAYVERLSLDGFYDYLGSD